MKDAHVTIYDVAARAGVSAATASRALAGLRVNAANHAAVVKAAADLGYVANEAARSLRVVRTMTVGMVFNQLTSQLGIELLDGLASNLDQMGYSLFVSTAQGDETRYDELVRRFLERRVDALICVHGHGEGAALSRYLTAGIPAISLITQGGGYRRLPLIVPSIAEAAQLCVDDIRAAGHRRISLLRPNVRVHLIDEFAGVARDAGLELIQFETREFFIPGEILAQLTAPGAPTALVARQAEAEQVLDAAEAAGLAVPEAFSLIAVRDRGLQPSSRKPLSMIHLDPGQVGAAAAAALRRWLNEKTPLTGLTRVSAGRWRDQGTLGPPFRHI